MGGRISCSPFPYGCGARLSILPADAAMPFDWHPAKADPRWSGDDPMSGATRFAEPLRRELPPIAVGHYRVIASLEQGSDVPSLRPDGTVDTTTIARCERLIDVTTADTAIELQVTFKVTTDGTTCVIEQTGDPAGAWFKATADGPVFCVAPPLGCAAQMIVSDGQWTPGGRWTPWSGDARFDLRPSKDGSYAARSAAIGGPTTLAPGTHTLTLVESVISDVASTDPDGNSAVPVSTNVLCAREVTVAEATRVVTVSAHFGDVERFGARHACIIDVSLDPPG